MRRVGGGGGGAGLKHRGTCKKKVTLNNGFFVNTGELTDVSPFIHQPSAIDGSTTFLLVTLSKNDAKNKISHC